MTINVFGMNFSVQAKDPSRVFVIPKGFGRDENLIKLTTQPGDDNIFGSGKNERTDVLLSQADTDGFQGRKQWWGHSFLFPDDYVPAPSWGTAIFDFHHTTSGGGQANLELSISSVGILNLHGNGGAPTTPTWRPPEYSANLGVVIKNVWYDMIYQIDWSSAADGIVNAWMNGKKALSYRGPTLYTGQGCYLKLQNYHPASGRPSSIIHSRVVKFQ